MPWDPKPAPPPPVNQSASSNHNGTPAQSYSNQSQNQNVADGQAHIKREPGVDASYNNGTGQNYMHQAMNPALAQQRAASLLQQQFGSQANASLGAMQQKGIALPGQQKQPGNLQLPGQVQNQNQTQDSSPNQQQVMHQQYAQQMKQQTAAQQPRIKVEDDQQEQKPFPQQQPSSLAQAQTDGSGDAMDDWNEVMTATRSLSAEQIAKNDHVMRDRVEASSQALDSGLMLPLEQQKLSKRRLHARQVPTAHANSSQLPTIPQLDGEFDDDDDKSGIKDEGDEDAINSDLDDDEDETANADEDDDDVDSMLCTYDKVQRVKNKWKCTLKDGVLSAKGKE